MGKSKAERYAEMKRPRMHCSTCLVVEVSDEGWLGFYTGSKFVSQLEPKKSLELAAWINDVFGEKGDE